MTELWAWMVEENPDDWNIIAAIVPNAFLPLVTSKQSNAELMRLPAEAHGRAAGKPIRLAHFVEQ